jgi:hypothetical protein
MTVQSYLRLPEFRKSTAFRKVPRLRPFERLVRATRRRWVWSIGGTIYRSTGRKTCPNGTSFTSSLIWTVLTRKENEPQLYLQIQSVPRSKNSTFRLYKPIAWCCIGKQSQFVLRSTQNIQIHCVGRTQNFLMLNFGGKKGHQRGRHLLFFDDTTVQCGPFPPECTSPSQFCFLTSLSNL